MSDPNASRPMSALGIGESGRVVEIRLQAADKARLMEMGILVGTTVELVRFAPLGDPIEIKARGYRLTLRKHEAESVLVNPIPRS